ncbi:MAG: zinc ribbon domain-containing protein [Lentisphaeria bacterium]|jgi:hypothetical protein|nr:zinc ribbon domain-containing protein [Lentisphaeria bacterium]
MKLCPFCAEEIQDAAVKCKHCGEFLTASAQPSPEGQQLPWYFRNSFIITAVLLVGPLALPLIWWRPRTPVGWKVGLTVAILVLSWFCLLATLKSVEILRENYRIMQELLNPR